MESTVILNGLITSVSSSLAGVIVRVACVKKDVDTLTGRLESIMAVIGDAERHRILARSEAADHRLKKLREIAYEAETIIDLFRIEVGTSRSQVLLSFALIVSNLSPKAKTCLTAWIPF
ncbi:hypothetical protein VPH35_082994 [Triticum aestivum]